MKIGFISPYFLPFWGGNERYVYNLAEGLIKLGNDVEVHCVKHLPEMRSKEEIDGIRVFRYKKSFSVKSAPYFSCDVNADILHTVFPFPTNLYTATTNKKRHEYPLFLTYHNDLQGVLGGLYNRVFAKYFFRGVDKILTTTPTYKENSPVLKHLDNVSVVFIGIDNKKFSPKISGSRIREKLGIDGKMILYVGGLSLSHRHKGIDFLIRAIKNVSKQQKVKLVLAGSGNWIPELKELSRKLDIEDRVIFTGRVDDKELPEYYAACDVFVLPSVSRAEGFGIVNLEAMATGKPVIGSDIGGIPYAIGNVGILTKPGSVKSLEDALLRVITDKKLAEGMGKKGLKKVRENFSLEAFANNMLKHYEEYL